MKGFIDFLKDELGIDPGYTLVALFFLILIFGASFISSGQFNLVEVLAIAALLSPIWLPLVVFLILFDQWIEYVQVKKLIGTEHSVLEIRLPEEINRSPLAMETVVNAMYHTGTPSDWYDGLVAGSTRSQFSLEICSFEGDVRFFIRCKSKEKDLIITQIYSQYPTVEVHEVEDYVERIQYDEKTMDLFGMEQKLSKPDPYPIKTYVDWGLDKPGLKEEEKVDPINSVLEFLGSLGKGEWCFMQIVIRSHVPDPVWGEGGIKGGPQDWQKAAEKEVKDLIEELKTENQGYTVYRPPHEGEKEIMEAVMRNVRKKPFDTGIRVVYFGYKDGGFRKDLRSAIPTMFRTFQSHTLNNFKPVFRTMFNWWFTNPFDLVAKSRKREVFQAYRWRSFFLPPYKRQHFVLSAEELVTVYHFPGRSVTTPSIRRAESRKSEAPSNIPK